MASKALPSPEVLRQLLRYEPDTGKLFWLPRPDRMFRCARDAAAWNAKHSGRPALATEDGNGYVSGLVFGTRFRAHRVAWAVQTGEWPADEIDHIDGNRGNNRFANLRAANRSQNNQNVRRSKANTSGVKGVHWYKQRRKWQAYIAVANKNITLGYFDSIEAAAAKVAQARAQYHGEFGRSA